VLATSLLDTVAYPITVFKDLYHCRWPVEEQYKVMKCRIEVENFSGKSVLAVYQDFHAKVFTMNLTAILAHPAQEVVEQESQEKQYTYHDQHDKRSLENERHGRSPSPTYEHLANLAAPMAGDYPDD